MTDEDEEMPSWAKELDDSIKDLSERLTEIKIMDAAESIKSETAKAPKPASPAEIAAILNKIM